MNCCLFFDLLSRFQNLDILNFPLRFSDGSILEPKWGSSYSWPPELRRLRLVGSFDYLHPLFCGRFANQLTHLTIENCIGLKSSAVYHWLDVNSKTLSFLKVRNWRPENPEDYLDDVLGYVPTLKDLRLSHRCVSEGFFLKHLPKFSSGYYDPPPENLRALPLRTLAFECQKSFLQGKDSEFAIKDWMVIVALTTQLGCLHTFMIDEALGWWSTRKKRDSLRLIRWVLGHQALLRGSNSKVSVIITPKNIDVGTQ